MSPSALRSNEATLKVRFTADLQRLSRIWFEKGLTLCNLRRYEEALPCYDRALAIDARNARVWYNKGLTLFTLQRHAEALAAFERALSIAPEHGFIWVQKGLTLSQLARFPEALDAFARALALDPTDAIAWHSKGAILYRLGRYDEALAAYDHTLDLESDKTVVWKPLGQAVKVDVQPEQAPQRLAPGASISATNTAVTAVPAAPATPMAQPAAFPEVAERPALAPNVQLLGQAKESGYKQQPWLIQRGGRYIQVTELIYRIAEHADGRRTLAEIAEVVSTATGRRVSAANVRHLIGTRLIPTGLIARADGVIEAAKQAPSPAAVRSPLALNLRLATFGPRVIDPITRLLQLFYIPPVLIAVLAAVATSQWWLFRIHGLRSTLRELAAAPDLMLVVVGMMFLSMVVHEFGHASALRYGGGRCKGIGIGFYLMYPAMYADVTDNYRLGRWARIRTDLGGFYFNLIGTLAVMVLYHITGQAYLVAFVVFTDATILMQMLPLVRFDGYWVLADLTGVPDIFTLIGPVWRDLLPLPRRSERNKLNLKTWVKVVLAAYTLVTIPALVGLLMESIVNTPRLISVDVVGLLKQLAVFSTALGAHTAAGMAISIVRLAFLALLTFGILFALFNIVRAALWALWRWGVRTPRRRVVATLTTLAALFLLTCLWMPQVVFGARGFALHAPASAPPGTPAAALETAPTRAWHSAPGMRVPRCCLAAVAGHDGRIYAIGGNNGTDLNTVEMFTPGANTWSFAPPMRTRRTFPAAVTGPDGRLYVMGGVDGSTYLASVEAYDPGTGAWSTVAPMPTARAYVAAALGPDGRIYVIGGFDGTSRLNTVEAYSPDTETWTTVAPMPTARDTLAAATGPDGRIYAIGGRTSAPVSTVEAYSVATNTWATVASMPTARYKLAAATGPDRRVYAIGGFTSTTDLNMVEAYSAKTGTWTTVTPLPTTRWKLAATTGADGTIYAIGGLTSGGTYLDTVEVYR